MHYSLTEMAEIRRLRKHLLWACGILVVVLTGTLVAVFAGAFLEAGPAGHDDSRAIFLNPLHVASLVWTGLVAYRLAKALDPRFHRYGTITALLFLLGPVIVIYLLIKANGVLAGPATYK